ncbi:MAG: hypothetical protein LAO56_04085 [Acidobacteriia bacterium]|nr:hypothetical protein [Terriglobia bacterium]
MQRTHRWMLVLLSLALLAPIAPAQRVRPTQTKHPSSHRKAPPKPLPLPPLRPGPLPQLPMDLIPAAPPNVVYENGLLMIVAQNSTLGDILRDVHKLTGATIDIPPNATERVVTRLGPGAPRDVLVSLLNGTGFNYVMLGSSADPKGVASIVLTAKPASGATQTAANTFQPPQPVYPNQMPVPQPLVAQQQVVAQPAATEGDEATDEQDAADENADQEQTDGEPDANGAAQQPQQPNAGPKTPEQILEMLRRQQPVPPGQPGAPPNQQPPQN